MNEMREAFEKLHGAKPKTRPNGSFESVQVAKKYNFYCSGVRDGRVEAAKEIEALKYDNTMLRGKIVEHRDEIEQLKAELAYKDDATLLRITEENKTLKAEIERLKGVVDEMSKEIYYHCHRNGFTIYLQNAIKAAEQENV